MGILRLLFYVAVAYGIYLLWKGGARMLGGANPASPPPESPEAGAQLVQDPNCKAYVDQNTAVRREFPGGVYFFCSEDCAKSYLDHKEDTPPN